MTRRGLLLFIAMCVIWGIPYLFIRVAVEQISPAVLVFSRAAIAAVILLPFALRGGGLARLRRRWLPLLVCNWPSVLPRPSVLLAVGVLALVCTALAFVLFGELIAEIGPVRSTVITYVNPAVAAVLGVVALGENLTLAMIGGFALILAGSVLATRRAEIAPAEA